MSQQTTLPEHGETLEYHGASLELRDLTLAYGPIEVLRKVSLSIAPGTTTCVIGPSGSGKSTLLRGINRLHEPKSGDVLLAGKSVLRDKPDALRLRIGMVFQHFNLFPDHSALENVALAPWKVKGMSKSKAMAIAQQRLDEVGLSQRADHRPRDLSGGQQQRVAIARALMMEPAVLLFDEPTAALDPEITAQIVSIIRELAQTQITQVIVTHEVEVARKTASRVVYMENGHIVEQGDASRFTQPQTEAFAHYLSH